MDSLSLQNYPFFLFKVEKFENHQFSTLLQEYFIGLLAFISHINITKIVFFIWS